MRVYGNKQAPTLEWFQGIVSEIAKLQQTSMLDDFELELQIQQAPADGHADPRKLPRPIKTKNVPVVGDNPRAVLENQIAFWESAADKWQSISSPYNAQECRIAAYALRLALDTMVK